jgi:hypothetical protein
MPDREATRVGSGRFGRAAVQSNRVFGPPGKSNIRVRLKKTGKDRTDRRIFGLGLAWDRPDPSVLGQTDRNSPEGQKSQ